MAKATLTNPIVVDPRTGNEVHMRTTEVDHQGNAVGITAEMRDAQGTILMSKSFQFRSAAVTAWIRSIEPDALNLVLSAMGVTGTIA